VIHLQDLDFDWKNYVPKLAKHTLDSSTKIRHNNDEQENQGNELEGLDSALLL